MGPRPGNNPSNFAVGAYAILGIDVVSFSTLDEENQIAVIHRLMRYVKESVAFHSLNESDYRWSPAGDGGYLTFVNTGAGRAAIDVAFSVFQKVAGRVAGTPGEGFRIRAALHAGSVREDADLGRDSNIWGMGINTTARILSVSDENQLLVSKQYFDTYIKEQREADYQFAEPYWRTVKHGVAVEVMNASKPGLCLDYDDASGKRWRYLGGLWKKTIQEYEFLISDAMRSGDPVAAIAAARYLLEMGEEGSARQLCRMLSDHNTAVTAAFPAQRHALFSAMPPEILFHVVRNITPRVVRADQILCEDGAVAESCFFPVSGKFVVEVAGREEPSPVKKGHIVGEFSLWVPNLKRTARIRSLDPGLVLELGYSALANVLTHHADIATIVYSIIQRRIIENVLLSRELFPGLGPMMKEELSKLGAKCMKTPAGGALDLSRHAFVMLIGRVRIHCTTGTVLEVEAEGRFDQLPVVGIHSGMGKPDGDAAEVLEETVAVLIDHDVLEELQHRYPAVRNAWGRLCGARLLEAGWHLS